MSRYLATLFFIVSVVILLIMPVTAQDTPELVAPRHLTFGAEGSLFVAYAGNGGEIASQGPFGPATAGGSGGVVVIGPDGSQEVLLHSLSSMDWGGGDTVGTHIAYPTDTTLWVLLGQGDRRNPFNYALVELEPENMRVVTYVDLYSFENQNNPDGEIIDSNPVDLVVAGDGTVYIADAGANSVLKWSMSGGLELFKTWAEDNPVPTSVEVDSADNVYVGFLSGFPFPPEGSRIEKYSAAGELLETFEGLNPVTDLEMDGDTLYAVERGLFGDQGWTPNTGRVVSVSSSGIEVIAEGLNLPYGMAVDTDGGIHVSVDSNTTGQIIQLGEEGSSSSSDGGSVQPPVATEEVPAPASTEDAG